MSGLDRLEFQRAPMPPTPAEHAFGSIKKQITQFEQSLAASEAVGVMLASFGQSTLLNVHTVSLSGQFICMDGANSDGHQARLVQHFTQVSLLLVKVQLAPEKPRRPIGFIG